jgi:aspartate ammonia-lyase
MLGEETRKNLQATKFSGKLLGHYPELIHALLDVKYAAVLSNLDGRLLDAQSAQLIAGAITQIQAELKHMSAHEYERIFPVDVFGGGGSIGIHLNVSEYVSLRSNVSVLQINQSQSTADVCHTAFRVAIIKSWPLLAQAIDNVVSTLNDKAVHNQNIMTLGRTCLQDASVISMGKSLSAYPEALERRKEAIQSKVTPLKAINLGGTAIGTGDNAPKIYRDIVVKHLSTIADLPLYHRNNLYDAAQNSDDIGSLAQELGQLALVLMKIARDMRMLSSGPKGGFFEIALPKVHEGSSFYKDKNNPIVPETMLQCGFLVLGACQTVSCALQHAELQLNVFDNIAAISVLDCMRMLTNSIGLFESLCLRGVVVNPGRCHELSLLASPLKNQGQQHAV